MDERVLNSTDAQLCRELLDELDSSKGHWVGRLSSSALATATAVVALTLVSRNGSKTNGKDSNCEVGTSNTEDTSEPDRLQQLIRQGLDWLVADQNADGGWGDCPECLSNISTTMLAHSALCLAGRGAEQLHAKEKAEQYIQNAGGVEAVFRRYEEDRTFSVPILTQCALAGTVPWEQVLPLPFELAVLPHRFFRVVQLPVVSYALPALIAVGQAGFHFRPPRRRWLKWLKERACGPTLRRLEHIQPSNGGFLEAVPLTSFVIMSLAAIGRVEHPVVKKGVEFLTKSVRPDGSWPIDTNLSTWLTTLSINALRSELPLELHEQLCDWLLKQQYRVRHPYTDAAPGGWAWTDLPGGVPDADDTPGAILALLQLSRAERLKERQKQEIEEAVELGLGWLLDLQNRDGGWPTFCRGWGRLPFDRSSPDISAHVLRAFSAWLRQRQVVHGLQRGQGRSRLVSRCERAVAAGFRFLERVQRPDGAWVPLWFGNQHAPDEQNPTYGTARVLLAYCAAGRTHTKAAEQAVQWLVQAQAADGGWGGAPGVPPSVEETALAVEALAAAGEFEPAARGIQWLLRRIHAGSHRQSAPIGFYFAKLWYSESLYPLIFAVGAFQRVKEKGLSTV